jgi:hypothetical protein
MLIETANVISTPDKPTTTGFPTLRAGLLLSSVMLPFYNWLNRQTLDLNDTGYHILGLGAARLTRNTYVISSLDLATTFMTPHCAK